VQESRVQRIAFLDEIHQALAMLASLRSRRAAVAA
jgi:hypothetical protein